MANASASAIVRLIKGCSFNGNGFVFKKKGESRIVTGLADIAYFESNPRFKVRVNRVKKSAVHAKDRKAAAPPTTPKDSDTPLLPWKTNSKKKVLLAAAHSREIAVTGDDKSADIVQLLKEHDEDNPPPK